MKRDKETDAILRWMAVILVVALLVILWIGGVWKP